jgi:four helix bundle protein
VTRKIKEDEFIFPFEKLEIWQCAVDLADYVLNLMESFPANKHFRLIGQMEAAVSSVAQNSAEGKGRQHKKEFIQFLYIAEGSLFEVLTLTELLNAGNLLTTGKQRKLENKLKLLTVNSTGLLIP